MKTIFLLEDYVPAIRQVFEKNGYQVIRGELDKEAENVEFVFSINFSPSVSGFCNQKGIKYVCWVVDSPHAVLYSQTFYYPCNYIFLFDYEQYCSMKARGGKETLFYLPLASDYGMFKHALESGNGAKYGCDVSFVGRLYKDPEHALFDAIKYIPPYAKGYLDSLMNIQHKIWGADILRDTVSNAVWEQLKSCVHWDLKEGYDDCYEETMISMIQQKIAQKERMEMCSMLAENFDFNLYTGDDTGFDPAIINRGYADYLKEMPLIFANSKININITLRSIQTGIPLRCLDIMACGGFLLTNYQAELEEYFEDGKELVIYQDFEDMRDKIQYYLGHEEERRKIAKCGQEKVLKDFSYEKQIGQMLRLIRAKEENKAEV